MEINTLDNLLRIGGTSGGSSGTNAPTLCDVDLDYSTEEGIHSLYIAMVKYEVMWERTKLIHNESILCVYVTYIVLHFQTDL